MDATEAFAPLLAGRVKTHPCLNCRCRQCYVFSPFVNGKSERRHHLVEYGLQRECACVECSGGKKGP